MTPNDECLVVASVNRFEILLRVTGTSALDRVVSLICMLTHAPYLRPKFRGGHLRTCDNWVETWAAEESFANGVGFLEAACDSYLRDRGDYTVFQHRFGSGANTIRAGIVANAVAIQKTRNHSSQRTNSRSGAQLSGINALSNLAAGVRGT